MTMKKVKDKVEWISFGEKYAPSENARKRRAWNYMFALNAFEEVSAGADEMLPDVKQIVGLIRMVCLYETGYELGHADADLVGGHYKGWKKNPYNKYKIE